MSEAVDLAYEQVGDGPPLVMLHGLFGSKRNWRGIARTFAARHSVYTLDIRNHGDSPHVDDMSYATLARDLDAFFTRHELTAASLLGHSLGGKVAMTYALMYPQRLKNLIIVDIGPLASPSEYDAMLDAMEAMDLAKVKRRADAVRALTSAVPDESIRAFVLQNLRFSADTTPSWRINLSAIARNISQILAPIDHPKDAVCVLPSSFIKGALSDRLDRPNLNEIAQRFPHFSLTSIEAAGHWPHSENQASFIDALSRFLSG